MSLEAELCRVDFYYKLEQAIKQCGGASDPRIISELQDRKLSEVVNILAQNGIRMTYDKSWHMDCLETRK